MNLSTTKLMSIVPNSLVRNVSRQVLVAKKNSPHIFFAAGVAGTVVSTVLACRATLKLSKALDEIKEEVDTVKEMHESINQESEMEILDNGRVITKVKYSQEEWYKDTVYVYTKASWKIVKLYGPSIIIGGISIAALTGSHVQLSRRNTALMAAYAALQTAFEEYRERVRFQYGDDRELDIYRGLVSHTEKDENGNKVEVKSIGDPNRHSVYARFFDEASRYWTKNPEMNRLHVQCQQNFANNLLQARGHVFLNEVYDSLGIERSTPGSVVGWVLHGDGDGYVSFGIFEPNSARFVNGVERSILLDFNVDGVIYDKI